MSICKYMRYQKGKRINDYTEVIDTWNHNHVEVKVSHEDNVSMIMKVLESEHLEEQKKIDVIPEATTWDNSTKHGIGIRRV